MAQIDNYLKSMIKLKANGLVLASDANVVLQFDSGDRSATQKVAHSALKTMLLELMAPAEQANFRQNPKAKITHDFDGQSFCIEVETVGAKFKVLATKNIVESGLPEVKAIPLGTPAPEPVVTKNEQPAAADNVEANKAVPRDSNWIDNILRMMFEGGSSDLHLSADCEPYWRRSGNIERIPNQPVMEPDFLEKQLMSILPERNKEEFAADNDTDFAYAIEGLSRFRVNIFRDRKGVGSVMRTIPFEIPSAKQLGLPDCILDMANLTKGLVLVTGPTGSGKSTTLAALIDHINETRECHIITVEDPVEFVHPNKKCLINQREISKHTKSFKRALKAALREDPDIVLVGEMRDLETIEIAVETAETGHLVFGTLHTTTAPSTVDRIIDQFPTDRQEQIRQMLAKSIKGVVSQVLCRKKGGGRIAAQEILIGTSAVENLIRERKTFQLFSLMQTGKNLGMQTMETHLLQLVKDGLVEPIEAYRKATNKSELKNSFERNGIKLDL